MSDVMPRELLAAFTRSVVDVHEDWDGMHQFMILVGKDGAIIPRVIGVIDPALHPDNYPVMMMKLAKEDIDGMGEHDLPPIGYMLQIEAFGVKMKPEEEMTDEEKEAFERDRRQRTIHTREDRIEICMAVTCDVTGRIYSVTKYRDDGSIVEEQIEPLGVNSDTQVGGQLTAGLRALASATGMMYWNQPGPPAIAN